MNVLQTKYAVVKYVGKQVFRMRLSGVHIPDSTQTEDKNDYDLMWCDGKVSEERLARMKPYQRVNHFPGMYVLSRKDYMARNLTSMLEKFPDEFKFFPKTWLLPSQFCDFRKQFKDNYHKGNGRKTFIVKP